MNQKGCSGRADDDLFFGCGSPVIGSRQCLSSMPLACGVAKMRCNQKGDLGGDVTKGAKQGSSCWVDDLLGLVFIMRLKLGSARMSQSL